MIFELAHAGSEEIPKPRCDSRPGAEYKFQEDGIPNPETFLASGA